MSEGVEELTPEERRVVALLALLQTDRAWQERNGAVVATVMSRIRWQLPLRSLLRAIGDLAEAVSGALLVLFRRRP